ncbi:hypothetical protein ACOSQ3_018244 [Xanthoceras sorbifolium]
MYVCMCVREREIKNNKIKTNHTLFLFSLLLRPKLNCVCFPCFCCITDSLHLFQVKEERREIKKINKEKKSGYEMGDEKKGRATAHGIYSLLTLPHLCFLIWSENIGQPTYSFKIIKTTAPATNSTS